MRAMPLPVNVNDAAAPFCVDWCNDPPESPDAFVTVHEPVKVACAS